MAATTPDLLAALAQTHLAEREYLKVLRPLGDALERAGNARGALAVITYEATGNPAAWRRADRLLAGVPAVDRARTAAARGRIADAAREMEDAGHAAAAAMLHEGAGEWAEARRLWSRLAHTTEGEEPYVAALVRYNLARCARRCGDAAAAREALVRCVRLLEEAADHFESIGQRERAFDCFQVITAVGREGGAFEDVLEGLVNSVRILREDQLKAFALEHLEEAIAAAAEQGEPSAAATLASDAAAYARSLGLDSIARGYALRQADLWRAVARQHADRGSPAELAESALVSAVLAYGEVGQHARAGALYAELAGLDVDGPRREQYARAAARYAGAKDDPIETSRPTRPEARSTEVWYTDVLEWEGRGSAAEVCADVLLDERWPHHVRRQALVARLTALEVDAREAGEAGASLVEPRARLAEQLSRLRIYPVLSPLEALFARPERQVKLAVLRAMQALPFKRTFVTVRAGLRDADAHVVEQAARTAELLLAVLDHGAPADQAAARRAVEEARGALRYPSP